MLVTSSGTHMVFYEHDLEDVYLQSIPIVLAYNKVNHYTAQTLPPAPTPSNSPLPHFPLTPLLLHNPTLFNKIPPTKKGRIL